MAEAFRDAFRRHPAGVAVITTLAQDMPIALTVSSLASVSADPPTVTFSLSSASSTSQAICQAETVVIHFLDYGDLHLATLASARGADRFGPDIAWERLPSGEPLYSNVKTWFRARIVNRMNVEGATVLAARLTEGRAASARETPDINSLVYCDRRWHRLGDTTDVAQH